MPKKHEPITVGMKIVGHELKEVREKARRKGDEPVVYEVVHIKFKGIGADRKTRMVLEVDPEQLERFQTGDKGEVTFQIRQGKLDLAAQG